MPDDPAAPQPTPTNYQRTTGGNHLRWQPPTPEHLQEILPAYEILSILGQGGMGAVYKGRQKSLDRIVAIKILPPEAGEDDMQFVERFKNEARTMAKMNHASIVHVYDFGETSDGQLYIVMEFIDGTDVAKMIQSQGKLPEDYALSITAHVCDALQYAHTHGIVHRDIKPANVLINMEGQVKVADFGLAKATDPSQMGLTKTNMAMGTPDFVSPEALIPGVPLDGRADLYAVGVMLYNMLTGTIPRGAFRMPSTTLQTDARFDKIIGKAMEMDRELRYQTALDLRRDLDVILTAPAAKTGVQTIPAQQVVAQQSLPQKPMGKSPSAPQQRSAGPPARSSPAADKSVRAPVQPPKKSNAGMIYGIAATVMVVAAAAFMFAGGGKKPASPPVAESQPEPLTPDPKPASPPKPPPTASTTTRTAPVSKSSDVLTFGGHRYQLLNESMTWDEAKTKARAMGGHLVTLTTKEEASFVRDKFLPQVLGLTQNVGMRRLLLGAQKTSPNTPWEWVTGERFDLSQWVGMQSDPKGTESHYLNWDYGTKRWDHSSARMEYFPLIEWDADGSAKPAPAPVAAAPATAGAINLLALVDVKRDAVAGDWTMTGKELALAKGIYGALEFQTTVPEEYDFEVEFTPQSDGNNVNQYISAGGHSFAWKLNAHARTPPLYGFELLDGKFSKDTSEARKEISKALQVGTRYRSTIEVRKGSLRALLDGEELVQWTGDFSRFSMENGTKLSDPKHLGVGAYKRGVVFHKAELRPPSGGMPAPQPAAATTPTMPASDGAALGWHSLFDENSFSAWTGPGGSDPAATWNRKDAEVASDKRTTLWSPDTHADFELEFEWKVDSQGNGGVFYHVASSDHLEALEMQLAAPSASGTTRSGGVYGVDLKLTDASKPPGEWNTAKLVVSGGKREHWINGEKVLAYDVDSTEFRDQLKKTVVKTKMNVDVRRGRPVLQANTGKVGYRNMRIRDLEPGGVTLSAAATTPSATSNAQNRMLNDPRIKQLEAGYQARYESDAQKPLLAALATLNQSYLANGISRARAAAQAKGSLAEVTALDAEKAAIEKGSSVPAEDATDTPASLKALRTTYRTALAKITADRDARAAPLLDLYLKALDVYIAELTKAGKIDEAKKVQSLRDEKAAKKSATAGSLPSAPTGVMAPAVSVPTDTTGGGDSSRQLAEWVLTHGGNLKLPEGGRRNYITKLEQLPAGKPDIVELTFRADEATAADIALLAAAPNLDSLRIDGSKPMPLDFLSSLKQLKTLNLPASVVGLEGWPHLGSLKQLWRLDLRGRVTNEQLAQLSDLGGLEHVTLEFAPTGTGFAGMRASKKLRILVLGDNGSAITDEGLGVIAATFPNLENCYLAAWDNPTAVTNEGLKALLPLKSLKALNVTGNGVDDGAVETLAKLRDLKSLAIKGTSISADGTEKLRKALPGCNVQN